MPEYGLGRLPAPDPRDQAFLMSSVVEEAPTRTYKYWWPGPWTGDQGSTSSCVGYSWVHWLNAGPVGQATAPALDPYALYRECQHHDEWPGNSYEGTSVRAGAKVLQAKGFIESYLWAWNVDTVVKALLSEGPVVVGTWWLEDMFSPNEKGLIRATGRQRGGHAYLLDGVNVKTELIRIKNSWGTDWGRKGFAYIPIEDMDKLITANGEACLAREIRVAA